MSPTRMLRLAFLCLLPSVLVESAHTQCLDWRAMPDANSETLGGVTAVTVFDAGSGPSVFVAGGLFSPDPPHAARNLLRWDGTAFHDTPGGLGGTINGLFSHDDGSGLALYAVGALTVNSVSVGSIARWNGSTWSVPGTGLPATSTCWAIYDDGTGTALYVGGTFLTTQGAPGDRIARWNGTSWSGFPNLPTGGNVRALAGFDDGAGPKLFVGLSGGLNGAYRLDSGTWNPLAPGTSGSVTGMQLFDDGSGLALYMCGSFNVPPATTLARWRGAGYEIVGNNFGSGNAISLAVADSGSGPALHVGATLSQTAPIRIWNGTTWTPMPGAPPPFQGFSGNLTLVTTFDTGSGPRLVAASATAHYFGYGCSIGMWTGSVWEPFQRHTGFSGFVRGLETLDLGSGPRLFACGSFVGAGTTWTNGITMWDGARWTQLPFTNSPNGQYTALGSFHVGGSKFLCATRLSGVYLRLAGGGPPTAIGTGSGTDMQFALQEFQGQLYIGGIFTHLNGTPTPNLGRWTGSSILGMGNGMNGAVNALTTFDDGTGLALYAAGTFTLANATPANRIARWDGTNWTPLGTGLNALCDTLVAFDDGTGPALFAAGTFTQAGGIPASCVAKWQNGTWSALGAGLNAQVLKLAVFDDGSGPALYAGGNFTASGTTPMARLARWNGVSWSALGASVDSTVFAMQSFDDGTGPQLFVGGTFHNAANQPSDYIASWRGCSGPISRYCFGDGTVAPCPCGNQGLSARGCDNSFATGGVRMNANGTTNPDTIEFYLAGLIPGTATMLFQGDTALSSPISFGDGLLCAGGNIRRLELAFAAGGTLGFPGGGSPSISAQSAAAGDPLLPGTVRGYQAWYRDANLSFCSAATSNVSNAVRIVW